jgi:hypothetical protein
MAQRNPALTSPQKWRGPVTKSGVIYISREISQHSQIGPYYDVVGTQLNFGRTSSMAILWPKFYPTAPAPKTRYLTYVYLGTTKIIVLLLPKMKKTKNVQTKSHTYPNEFHKKTHLKICSIIIFFFYYNHIFRFQSW